MSAIDKNRYGGETFRSKSFWDDRVRNATIIKALQASMIPRHEKILQYNCKEYLIDIHELICVNKIL